MTATTGGVGGLDEFILAQPPLFLLLLLLPPLKFLTTARGGGGGGGVDIVAIFMLIIFAGGGVEIGFEAILLPEVEPATDLTFGVGGGTLLWYAVDTLEP